VAQRVLDPSQSIGFDRSKEQNMRWFATSTGCRARRRPRILWASSTPLAAATTSTRILTVAPASPAAYFAVFDIWATVWRLLTPDANLDVRQGS
jgi:hypothetical protein